MDEEIPPDNVKRFECLEKAEKGCINVIIIIIIFKEKNIFSNILNVMW